MLIEPLGPPHGDGPLRPLRILWGGRRRGAVATVIATRGGPAALGKRLWVDDAGTFDGTLGDDGLDASVKTDLTGLRAGGEPQTCRHQLPGGWADVFVDVIVPPLGLVVFGAGGDVVPLASFAKGLGWHVTVVDLRSGVAGLPRRLEADEVVRCRPDALVERLGPIPTDAAVVMTHNYAHDFKALKYLAADPPPYVGLLGPRHRTRRLLEGLADGGVPVGVFTDGRLHAARGAGRGARTPEEVALAIVAEITAATRSRGGGPLRDRPGPIHVDSAGVRRDDRSAREGPACPVAAS